MVLLDKKIVYNDVVMWNVPHFFIKEVPMENEVTKMYRERKHWVFLGLPFTFTVYEISDEYITTNRGFLNRTQDDCYMYKVQDVKYNATLIERMFGLGTVICYTGDVTDQKLELQHIRHAVEIKNYILAQSEKARIKRRTINMQNIGADSEIADVTDSVVSDGIFD